MLGIEKGGVSKLSYFNNDMYYFIIKVFNPNNNKYFIIISV